MSPGSLQRKYLPRTRNTNTARPHPAAAAATRAAQVQHPHAPHRPEMQTKRDSTTNRNVRVTLTRFKDGFERQTENELAQAFKRPPRLFKEDTPFYPWLPPEPRVNFNLNFKL